MKNMMRSARFASGSWAVAAILICLFPPLGMIPLAVRGWLERKLHDPKHDHILGPAIGVLLFCFCELVMLTLIFWGSEDLAALLLFAPGLLWGGAMLLLRRKYRKQDALERLAVTVVTRGHVTDLGKIGECLGLTKEGTAVLLESLIRRGVLRDCSVDRDGGCLQVDAPWASVRYRCPYCGGDQIVDLGVQLTCQYCDSALTMDRPC